jgi:UPF0271 protein
MKFVLDSSAILSGKINSSEHEFYTSPLITQELERSEMKESFQYLIDAGLRIMAPSQKSIQQVHESARKTGDINRLSEPDMELLSLALELDGVIMTNDYSIQNLASELKIPFLSPDEQEITKVITWQYQCKGCAQIFEEKQKDCPVCGSELRFRPKSIKNV